MKFIISRTSARSGKKPIKEAKKVKVIRVDRRTVKTLKEVGDMFWGKAFLQSGENHREEFGGVARDMVYDDKDDSSNFDWEIGINNLKQMINLAKSYGEIIIMPCNGVKGYKYEIEIYDGYRE